MGLGEGGRVFGVGVRGEYFVLLELGFDFIIFGKFGLCRSLF